MCGESSNRLLTSTKVVELVKANVAIRVAVRSTSRSCLRGAAAFGLRRASRQLARRALTRRSVLRLWFSAARETSALCLDNSIGTSPLFAGRRWRSHLALIMQRQLLLLLRHELVQISVRSGGTAVVFIALRLLLRSCELRQPRNQLATTDLRARRRRRRRRPVALVDEVNVLLDFGVFRGGALLVGHRGVGEALRALRFERGRMALTANLVGVG